MSNIICYKNIVFYKGNFYVTSEQIRTTYLHNRLMDDKYKFTPLDIDTIKLLEKPVLFDKGILLLHHFHWNMGHMLWDHIYPFWYGLFYNYTQDAEMIDFQWLCIAPLSDKHVSTYKDIVETFSGNSLHSLTTFSARYNNKPLLIPWLITNSKNIGISHINKINLYVERGLTINNLDPIETFVNRMYRKYNVKRNTLFDKSNFNICNNVIYIVNKRPYFGIDELFIKKNKEYLGKYNFKIINYNNYNFKEQLELLNTTCLCIVGVGNARFNTPFLPNGAIEIQTFNHSIKNKNFIEYFDYHGGTLSNYIKIVNIPYYTQKEAIKKRYSGFLEEYIDRELLQIPCKIPVNFNDHVPSEIKNLMKNKNYDKLFDVWRNSNDNIVDNFFKLFGE